jgi:hypothetical protein
MSTVNDNRKIIEKCIEKCGPFNPTHGVEWATKLSSKKK